MRYLIAMISAVVFAGVATLFVSSPIASWAVRQYTFNSPDSVSDLHALVFMASNLAGLVAGWLFGWVLGGWLVTEPTEVDATEPPPGPPSVPPRP